MATALRPPTAGKHHNPSTTISSPASPPVPRRFFNFNFNYLRPMPSIVLLNERGRSGRYFGVRPWKKDMQAVTVKTVSKESGGAIRSPPRTAPGARSHSGSSCTTTPRPIRIPNIIESLRVRRSSKAWKAFTTRPLPRPSYSETVNPYPTFCDCSPSKNTPPCVIALQHPASRHRYYSRSASYDLDLDHSPRSSFSSHSSRSSSSSSETIVLTTLLAPLPFCCHQDLLNMPRERLLEVVALLNGRLPARREIRVTSGAGGQNDVLQGRMRMKSDVEILREVEDVVGIWAGKGRPGEVYRTHSSRSSLRSSTLPNGNANATLTPRTSRTVETPRTSKTVHFDIITSSHISPSSSFVSVSSNDSPSALGYEELDALFDHPFHSEYGFAPYENDDERVNEERSFSPAAPSSTFSSDEHAVRCRQSEPLPPPAGEGDGAVSSGSMASSAGTNEFGVSVWALKELAKIDALPSNAPDRASFYSGFDTACVGADAGDVMEEEEAEEKGWGGESLNKIDEVSSEEDSSHPSSTSPTPACTAVPLPFSFPSRPSPPTTTTNAHAITASPTSSRRERASANAVTQPHPQPWRHSSSSHMNPYSSQLPPPPPTRNSLPPTPASVSTFIHEHRSILPLIQTLPSPPTARFTTIDTSLVDAKPRYRPKSRSKFARCLLGTSAKSKVTPGMISHPMPLGYRPPRRESVS